VTGFTPGQNAGVAGFLKVSASAGLGLPGLGDLFKISGSVTVMFNTTRQDQVFHIPEAFLPLLKPGEPTVIEIFASAPALDGTRNPRAPPGGEVYVQATIQAELSIGGVISLVGFIQIEAAASAAGRRLKLTGAVNLNVLIGTASETGVVGRVFLALSGNIVPGISFSGAFLLEINTFPNPNAPERTIDTFKLKKKTVNGRELFD